MVVVTLADTEAHTVVATVAPMAVVTLAVAGSLQLQDAYFRIRHPLYVAH